MLNCLVKVKNGSAARITCSTNWSGKYCIFLICSQEKHLHFQEESQGKSGKNIKQNVYEACYIEDDR